LLTIVANNKNNTSNQVTVPILLTFLSNNNIYLVVKQQQQQNNQYQQLGCFFIMSQYAEKVTRQVPGYHDLQSMALILLEEGIEQQQQQQHPFDTSKNNIQDQAKSTILVVGAGGGMELFKFGTAHPNDWNLVGIDPSIDMLQLAQQRTETSLTNITYYHGLVTDSDAPKGPYDGATCLLTLHFLSISQRLDTLQAIYNVLKPGAPLIVAHHSIEDMKNDTTASSPPPTLQPVAPPTTEPSSSSPSTTTTTTTTTTPSLVIINPWLRRYAAYTAAHSVHDNPVSVEQALRGAQTIQQQLPYLSPQQDEELLEQAGFDNIQQFYMAFTFRGWVAYKPK
jgi:tRNA (cmo5U34)-methyltransferase